MFSKRISSLGPILSWYPLLWHFLSLPVLRQGFPKKSLPSPSSLPLELTQPFCFAPVSAQNFSRSCSPCPLAFCRTVRWQCWEGRTQWWSSSVLQVRDLGRVESDIAAPPPTRQRNPNCSPWLLPRCQKVQRREVLLSIGSLYPRKKGDTRQRHPPGPPEPDTLRNSLNFLSRISNLIAHVFHQQSTRVGATAGAGAQTPTKGKKRCEILWIFFLGNVATSHTMPHIIKFAKCFYPF